ncbi:hypothetical protein, partial [Agromyces sp. CCNWLW208]
PRASAGTPSAAAGEKPIFASDEEALAAAVEAYEAYSEMSTRIASEGGARPERIAEVVGADAAPELIAEFEAMSEANLRTSGVTKVYGARLMKADHSGSVAQVSAYFCRDVSKVRILDASGADVTKPRESDITAVLGEFESVAEGSPQLILKRAQSWQDNSFCKSQ